jgi:hypothetical protein
MASSSASRREHHAGSWSTNSRGVTTADFGGGLFART